MTDKYYPGRVFGNIWICRLESLLGAAFTSILPQGHAVQCFVAIDRILKLHPRTAVKVAKSKRYKPGQKFIFAMIIPLTIGVTTFSHNFKWKEWDLIVNGKEAYYIVGYPYFEVSPINKLFMEIPQGTPKEVGHGYGCHGQNLCFGSCDSIVTLGSIFVLAVCISALVLINTFIGARKRAAAAGNSWKNVTSNQTLALVSIYDSLLSIAGLLFVSATEYRVNIGYVHPQTCYLLLNGVTLPFLAFQLFQNVVLLAVLSMSFRKAAKAQAQRRLQFFANLRDQIRALF